MIELTESQRQELREAEPLAIDPRTRQTYVLVRKEVYDQLRGLLHDEINMRTVALLIEQGMKEDDANDPTLGFYQEKYGQP